MEGIRAWLQDRKNLPIVTAGTGIILIIVVLVILKTTGKIGGGPGAAGTGMPGYTPTAEAPSAQYPGAEAPGAPPAVAPGAAPQPVAVAGVRQPPMLPYRKDPFEPLGGPPKKTHMLEYYLPNVTRQRLAPAPVVKQEAGVEAAEALPPQPIRRMAGVMWNGRIAAILETNGESKVVRPGDVVTSGGSRVLVDNIQPDCIILKTLDTRTPMTIKVSMGGAVTTGQPGYMPSAPIYPAGPEEY